MADDKQKMSAQEIAYHAEALYKKEWDAERNAIRNPNMVFLGLLSYVRLTATRLHDANKQIEALESRVAAFETRLTTMERWKDEAEAQTDMLKAAGEEMMKDGPDGLIKQLIALKDQVPGNVVALGAAGMVPGSLPPTVVDTEVVETPKPSQNDKQERKRS